MLALSEKDPFGRFGSWMSQVRILSLRPFPNPKTDEACDGTVNRRRT